MVGVLDISLYLTILIENLATHNVHLRSRKVEPHPFNNSGRGRRNIQELHDEITSLILDDRLDISCSADGCTIEQRAKVRRERFHNLSRLHADKLTLTISQFTTGRGLWPLF